MTSQGNCCVKGSFDNRLTRYQLHPAAHMTEREVLLRWDLVETHRLMDHPAVRTFKEHHAIAVPGSHLRAFAGWHIRAS
jgi:hypothetical protein